MTAAKLVIIDLDELSVGEPFSHNDIDYIKCKKHNSVPTIEGKVTVFNLQESILEFLDPNLEVEL